jgi:hypothetical protein
VEDDLPARHGVVTTPAWRAYAGSPSVAIAAVAALGALALGGPWLVWFAGGLVAGVSLSGST